MAWIEVGGIQFYSLADSITSLVYLFYNLLFSLWTPWIGFMIIMFFMSLLVYFVHGIGSRIDKVYH